MKIVVFGLTISSSWGNGHATLWRGLCRALAERQHRVVFFEQDTPYYRRTRDLFSLDAGRLDLYSDWDEVKERAERELRDADVAIVTSYCPDGVRAAELVLERSRGVRVFYDLDTPVTLAAVAEGNPPPYLPARGLGDFDLVLSFTGGSALDELRERLHARRVAPLYGHVDPEQHRPAQPLAAFQADLSYLGTYSADRHEKLEELFFGAARAAPERRFLLGGAQYPHEQEWPANVHYWNHVEPSQHPAFFCSSRLTLNVTRGVMARFGYCPSGRLFEAAACGAAIVSDDFEGLGDFFTPGVELGIVRDRADVLRELSLGDEELRRRAAAARARVLSQHTARHRVLELERLLGASGKPLRPEASAGARVEV